ncbi:glycosyltransferase family 2 protein [bacterium D16-51]|nr:glycosyltransferase family 2 protein [bacterium D16-59]RKI56970.1 glycosyltransferase family 2 protein [bacterium D16-51]
MDGKRHGTEGDNSMDRKIREIKTNKAWECYKSPAFTVITPVYNRKKLIGRAMASVEKQSFRDFEYIVIDDGSIEEESIDDIMEEFMERVSFPVMFIKKENGGVHTARNLGTVHGRGMLWCALDSDDCLLEDALEKMYCAWQEIPLGKRSQYYGVVTRCIDGNGQIIGKAIPAQINEQGWKTARKFKMSVKGELHGACAMQVMKKHLWPEPEGVTFVTESILWCYLDMKYRQYLTNKTTRTYYLDNAWEHLSGGGAEDSAGCEECILE